MIQAIITAINHTTGISTTFCSAIVPVRIGDIIMYNKKDFVVTAAKQELKGRAGAPVMHIKMEYKEDMACLFK